jgi:hypothetical protein
VAHLVRDEGVAGSNPATPTSFPTLQRPTPNDIPKVSPGNIVRPPNARAVPFAASISTPEAGGIALLGHAGELLAVEDLPALPGVKGRASLNGALLALVIRRWSPSHAYVEFVASRPTDSRAGAFSFCRARGCTGGFLAACGVPARWLTVQSGASSWDCRRLRGRITRGAKPSGAGRGSPNHSRAFVMLTEPRRH